MGIRNFFSLTPPPQPTPPLEFNHTTQITPTNTTNPWIFINKIAELDAVITWRANAASRIKIEYQSNDQAVDQHVNRILTNFSDIIESIIYHLLVTGECYVGKKNNGTWIAADVNDITFSVGNTEFWFKNSRETICEYPIYLQFASKKNPNQPASSFFSSTNILNEIILLDKLIARHATSRIATAGILAIPEEASLPATQREEEVAVTANTLQHQIVEAAIKNYDAENYLGSLPITVTAPSEYLANIQHIEIPTVDIEKLCLAREKSIQRLAMGLDISPERLLGIGSNSNHWSSWLIESEDVEIHVKPLVMQVVSQLLEHVLQPNTQTPLKLDNFTLDTTGLIQDAEPSKNALELFDRGQLTGKELRNALDLDHYSGYDLTTEAGKQQFFLDQEALNARK